ncbi:hypothetical protein JOY44_16165 [Phormidium sp. CLA17]|uniref:hypothetical protein n=1 Tax=Leptolyngbya sp. Cla-17 TaxID=2803751 RepID=UPI001490B85A|nr:hypothetical protein [Leptolyngbya sp. Cla-17]MBM0743124.1 hypothetical protein [Leptolyngbya sp. Cla-17]
MSDAQKSKHVPENIDDEWQHDLHPNPMAGQNHGIETSAAELEAPTAFDLKEVHQHLSDLSSEELKRIRVLPAGTRLKQGATYIDLNDPKREQFSAMGNQEAGSNNWYVPKTEVDYELWNLLTGVQDPNRLDQSTPV